MSNTARPYLPPAVAAAMPRSTNTPLVEAYRSARQTGERWVHPADEQRRRDARARGRQARASRRINRRRSR